jgi:hypothetical protein
VKFAYTHNEVTGLFDIYLVVLEGEASHRKELIQFNSQISMFAPKGSSIEIVKSYMPKSPEENSVNWEISNYLDDVKGHKDQVLFSIKPALTKNGYYLPIKEGDSIKLFSIRVENKNKLSPSSLRFYRNGFDITAEDAYGSDFSNGFTMGGTSQLYKEVLIDDSHIQPQISTGANEISIYPIPASNVLTVKVICEEGSSIVGDLYDMNGALLTTGILQNKRSSKTNLFPISLTGLSGVYYLRLNIDGEIYNRPIIMVKP